MSRQGPPKAFQDFADRFPRAAEAWTLLREEEQASGPADDKTRRLLKLAIAVGHQRPGSVHSAARKAKAAGLTLEEMEQVVALSISTVGLPAGVAALGWIREEWHGREP